MRDAFDSQDVSRLQAVAAEMDKEEFNRHLKRCIDSGLWVPNAADRMGEEVEDDPGAGTEGTSVSWKSSLFMPFDLYTIIKALKFNLTIVYPYFFMRRFHMKGRFSIVFFQGLNSEQFDETETPEPKKDR